MKQLAIRLSLALGFAAASFGSASALECGGSYVVLRGDTISKIAMKVYGPNVDYRALYRANRRLIGSSPSHIRVGRRISLPCDLGRRTVRKASLKPLAERRLTTAPAPQALKTPQAPTREVAPRKARYLTATGFAPFTDAKMPKGGMITEMIEVAMATTGGEETGPYRIDFINDVGAHLSSRDCWCCAAGRSR